MMGKRKEEGRDGEKRGRNEMRRKGEMGEERKEWGRRKKVKREKGDGGGEKGRHEERKRGRDGKGERIGRT